MNFWTELIINLVNGLIITLKILAISIPLGVALGITLGSLKVYGGRILSTISSLIVNVFTGLPVLVTLLILFYGLADIGVILQPFWAASTAFILCSGSYISRYVEAGIRSIEEGQSQAAEALGMNKVQELIHIILPQALRKSLPSISNEIIYLVKYSSLAYIIGVPELFSVAKTFNSLYFKSIEIFTITALIYLTLTSIVYIWFRVVENRFKIPGL